jgi:Dyp-type peroxidase family
VTLPKNTEWKPPAADARDVQGIVISAYPKMLNAAFLMVQFGPVPAGTNTGAKAWLQDVATRITNAEGERSPSINLAISAAGLRSIGLDETVMSTFARPFREGMTFGNRPRFLGDVGLQDPSNWDWSDCASRPTGVHALLMLYARDLVGIQNLSTAEKKELVRFGLTLVGELCQQVNLDSQGVRHEHFGFADGISQPVLVDGDAVPVARRAIHEIAAGEVVLGQTNTYGTPAAGPLVAKSSSAERALQKASLAGFFDLGRNGTYLVVRQLKQDVTAFWDNMNSAKNGLTDEQGTPATAEWLAEKSVGRTKSGELLTPGGTSADNDRGFFATDRAGYGCPVTSHIRRANPRDGLAPKREDVTDIIQATNRHRIMRRGRIYGEPAVDPLTRDNKTRGLIFACLNSEIDRQFEFVQHTWLLNPMFGGAFDQSDPLIGPQCPFRIPSEPVRQQPVLETFITVIGGGYFFLPSLSAIRYLGQI